jgi:predicted amidohydrolase YtcJ
MKKPVMLVAVVSLVLVGCTKETPQSKAARATLVLHNGIVYTADAKHTMAEAIGIAGDRIIAVGSNAEVDKLIDTDTKVVDLKNRFVVPGLIDAHIHAVSGASVANKCTFEDAQLTVEQMKPIVAACLKKDADAGGADWFQVVSVNPSGLTATAKDIDGLVADRPTFLIGSDGHTGWLNTAGLQAMKFTKSTPDPNDGKIGRDGAGEPTGKLVDAAVAAVLGEIPKPSPQQKAQALETLLPSIAATGITSLRDPAVDDDTIGVYKIVSKAGKLTARVASSFTVTETKSSPDELVKLTKAFRERHPGTADRLTVDQVKFFADGVIEAPTWTAAMIDPYLDKNGKPTDNRGELYIDPKLFGQQVKALHEAGYSIHVHAIGDRATRVALDGFASAGPAPKSVMSRDQIVHLEVIDSADVKRFKALNVIAGFQADWAFREAYTVDALEPFMGPSRYENVYPIGSVAQTGATIAGGSDWPVSTFNPFQAMQRAVTRRDTKQAEALGAKQAVSRQQALDMYTSGAAVSLPFEGIGVLAVGNKADLAVLNQNPLTVDENSIEKTVSELTLVDGQTVYEKS